MCRNEDLEGGAAPPHDETTFEDEESDDGHGHHGEGNNGWCRGVVKEFKMTLGTHWKEEMTNLNFRTVGVSFFMFIAAVSPAITFGAVYAKSTDNFIGAIEMILATAWCGIVYGLIGGQPMMINGATGPILAFSTVLFKMSNDMDIPFLTLNAWTGIWIAAFMILAAVTDLNRIVGHLSRFTDEIFSGLISAIFIIDALGNPFGSVGVFWFFSPNHKFHEKYADDPTYSRYATAFLSCILCFGTSTGAFKLRSLKRSRFLPNQTCRNIVCDFAVITNLIIWTIIAKAGFKDVPVETLNVPDFFAPTLECCDATCRTSFPSDCPEQESAWGRRSWLVNLFDTNGKAWVPFFAAVPAILAFILVFLDNGITWHLIQEPSNKLMHGRAYNYDTIIVGALLGINSVLGLPWLVASTVPSIIHVQAMSDKDDRGKIIQVQETRLTHIFIHCLILGATFALQILKLVPVPVLYGVFLFMGIVSLASNEFWHRFNMLFMQQSRLPDEPFTKYVAHKRVHAYTLIQVFLFICLVVFRSIPQIAVAFPLIIKLCIPVRMFLLPYCFSKEELILLDGESPVIKKLVRKYEKEEREGEAVLRESRRNKGQLDAAGFDYADENTRA